MGSGNRQCGYGSSSGGYGSSIGGYGGGGYSGGMPLEHGGGQGDYGQVGQPNPWLGRQFNRAADTVEGRMRDSTAMQGLTNSGVQQTYQRGLNDLATNIYGGAYENDANRRLQSGMFMSQSQQNQRNNDLNRMLTASQALPGMLSAGTQYGLGLGDVERNFDQARINEGIRSFEQQRLYPYGQLDVLGRALGMSMGSGGSTTSTSPGYYQPSGTAGMLGGGLTALGLVKALSA